MQESRSSGPSAPRDETQRAPGAGGETAFQQGEAALRKRDDEGALRFFGTAMERFTEHGEVHAQRRVKLARHREKPYFFPGRPYEVVSVNPGRGGPDG